MFTPDNIQMALEDLFSMYDSEKMAYMLENYGEEFEDIDAELLAQVFQRNADMVCGCHVVSYSGEGMDYYSSAILDNRAVKLLSINIEQACYDRVLVVKRMELWLEEDMTFSVLSCIATYVMDDEDIICLTEHRSFITALEKESDIFFDMADLVCELDDMCLFEILLENEAAVCEP